MKKILLANNTFEEAVSEAVTCLKSGGVVAFPTETVYGLAVCWQDQAARQKIYELKRRPENKLLQMLAADANMIENAGVKKDLRLEKIAETFWPGALTLVCPAEDGSTIGARIPDHPFVLALLEQLGQPLAATSANLSGEKPGVNAEDAVKNLAAEPDLLFDGGPARIAEPSTVASIVGDEIQILRPGPITLLQLNQSINNSHGG